MTWNQSQIIGATIDGIFQQSHVKYQNRVCRRLAGRNLTEEVAGKLIRFPDKIAYVSELGTGRFVNTSATPKWLS